MQSHIKREQHAGPSGSRLEEIEMETGGRDRDGINAGVENKERTPSPEQDDDDDEHGKETEAEQEEQGAHSETEVDRLDEEEDFCSFFEDSENRCRCPSLDCMCFAKAPAFLKFL